MHVVIHEPNPNGHRFTTVRVLLDALLNLNKSTHSISRLTLAVTKPAMESDEFRVQIQPVADQIDLYLLPDEKFSKNAFLLAHRRLMGLRLCLQDNDADHLYLPYTDFQLQLLTLYRLIPLVSWWPPKPVTEAQLMTSTFAYGFGRKSRKLMSLMAVKYSGCDRVHLNDPLAINYLREHHPKSLAHIKGIPDPITHTEEIDKATARDFFNLPQNARIIGCLGVINERKGADILVNAFLQAPLLDTDILLLAGRLSPKIKSIVEAANDPRIVCLDRYITEEELSNAISAMDLVVTPYKQVVGSASIIIRAAVANRMVLSSDTGWSGVIVPQYGLGLTSSVGNTDAFSTTLVQAIEAAPTFKPGPTANNFVRYNSEKNVQDHWVDLLKSRLDIDSKLVSLTQPR